MTKIRRKYKYIYSQLIDASFNTLRVIYHRPRFNMQRLLLTCKNRVIYVLGSNMEIMMECIYIMAMLQQSSTIMKSAKTFYKHIINLGLKLTHRCLTCLYVLHTSIAIRIYYLFNYVICYNARKSQMKSSLCLIVLYIYTYISFHGPIYNFLHFQNIN